MGTSDGSGSPTNAGLNASSHGVMGMSGVTLQSTPQGGTVSSEGKNVKLDSGLQMVLRNQ